MLTYEEIKNWLSQKENKDKVMLAVSFVLVFLVGYGAGSFVRHSKLNTVKSQTNYTTTTAKTPTPAAVKTQAAEPKTQVPAVAGAGTADVSSNCLIKGNISSSKRKIYHMPGGALYKVVKPEQCFNTEAEAVAAGFVKSGR